MKHEAGQKVNTRFGVTAGTAQHFLLASLHNLHTTSVCVGVCVCWEVTQRVGSINTQQPRRRCFLQEARGASRKLLDTNNGSGRDAIPGRDGDSAVGRGRQNTSPAWRHSTRTGRTTHKGTKTRWWWTDRRTAGTFWTSSTWSSDTGVAQGSVLGPLGFTKYSLQPLLPEHDNNTTPRPSVRPETRTRTSQLRICAGASFLHSSGPGRPPQESRKRNRYRIRRKARLQP